jgi:tetratricopeptide (TPR) repeat protein
MNIQLGNIRRALDLNKRLEALQPASPEHAAQSAFLLQELGRTQEAEDTLLQSARTDPYYFQTYSLLTRLWASTGQFDKAKNYFAALVGQMPESRAARIPYAQLLARSGDWSGAEQQWKAVLESVPDEEAALGPMTERLQQQGKIDAAVELMLKAYAYNPRNFANNARLEQIFEERGDLEQTVKYLRAMAESGPVKAVLHADLAADLQKLGRKEEMRIELRKARAAAEAEGDMALLKNVENLIQQYESRVP